MNTRGIAIVGSLLLGLLVVRYLILSRRPAAPSGAAVAHLTSFEEGMAKAKADHKVLVVDAMATWCGPCKMMDRDSWSNPDVQAWLNENAVFAQVDVDQHAETAKQLGIEAMPTVIIFRDGGESKRVVGYRDASELLEWLRSG